MTCPGSCEVAVGFHAWVTSQGPTWLGHAAEHRRMFQGQRPQFIGEETESSRAHDQEVLDGAECLGLPGRRR